MTAAVNNEILALIVAVGIKLADGLTARAILKWAAARRCSKKKCSATYNKVPAHRIRNRMTQKNAIYRQSARIQILEVCGVVLNPFGV